MSDGLSFFQRIAINYLKLDPKKIGKLMNNLTGGEGGLVEVGGNMRGIMLVPCPLPHIM